MYIWSYLILLLVLLTVIPLSPLALATMCRWIIRRDYLFYFLQVFSIRYKISITQTKTSGKAEIKRVFLVDDEQDITFTIKTTLENTGFFQVETFNGPELALSTLRSGVYDLALLDIGMPKMNGFQLFS